LEGSIAADNATRENMEKLIKAGEVLLEQPVKILNVTSFTHHEKVCAIYHSPCLDNKLYIQTQQYSKYNINFYLNLYCKCC